MFDIELDPKLEEQYIKEYGDLVTEYSDDITKAYVGFKKLEEKLKNKKNPPKDAGAVAAAIGRKKYGKKKFQEAAAEGHKMKKALTSQSADAQPTTQETPDPKGTIEAPKTEAAAATPEPAKEAPAPKLAPGLFGNFTLGSTLAQGPRGNIMTNMKPAKMDYEKQYQGSTKNQKLTSEELKQLNNKK